MWKRNGFRKNDPKNKVKDDHDDKKVRVTMVGHVMEIFMLVTQPSILGCARSIRTLFQKMTISLWFVKV